MRIIIKKIIRKLIIKYRLLLYNLISDNNFVGPPPLKNQPVLFTGKGKIIIEKNVRFGVRSSPNFYSSYAHVEARNTDSNIHIGENTWFNNGLAIISDGSTIEIGSNCVIGHGVFIVDSDFHAISPFERKEKIPHSTRPVKIGNHVFIGSRAIILKGTTIEDGATIGAGSVVSGDVPKNTVVAGNPARIVRSYLEINPKEEIGTIEK